jgi:phage terminase large subunit GpA-like protein
VPCPHCREQQTLELENLRWPEGRPRDAEYACAHCGSPIGERHKTWMLEHGEWRPTAPGDGRTAGFHLSSLYSPVGWFSWADAAEMYEHAQKTPDLMKGFVNTVLGLPFEEEAEAPEWQRLYDRREAYRSGIVPERGLFLTAGVDVQKDRIEVEVVAWGRGKESWSVDYRVIEGDTARAEVWAKLDAVLAKDWPHAIGHTLPIGVMCVDAGYATQDVYAWVRRHPQASWGPAGAAARQPRTAVAVKGRDQDTALLLSVSRGDAGGKRRGLRVWSVGTPVAKGELYRWLKLEWPTEEALDAGASYPPGACHFPQYGEEYFKQLTAERLVTRIVKGFPRGSWEKEPGCRNEALDCRVYARAAAAIYGLDRFEERHWRRMEAVLARTAEQDDHRAPLPRTPAVRAPARQVIHSGYMAR